MLYAILPRDHWEWRFLYLMIPVIYSLIYVVDSSMHFQHKRPLRAQLKALYPLPINIETLNILYPAFLVWRIIYGSITNESLLFFLKAVLMAKTSTDKMVYRW